MLPRDFDGDTQDQAEKYLKALEDWKQKQAKLRDAQARARTEFDAAVARLGVLLGWFGQLAALINALSIRRPAYDTCVADLANLGPIRTEVEDLLADRAQAYAVATSRLLGDAPTSLPIVLLPLRIETHWTDTELQVRIFPDDIGINSHDGRITVAEQSAGIRYWQAVNGAADGDAGNSQRLQAWEELVRQVGAPRAAWVARASDAAGPEAAATLKSSWEVPVSVPLLPDRFAVIAILNRLFLATDEVEPRFVTWGNAIPPTLSYAMLAEPGTTSWLTDFATAESMGMAVRMPISRGEAPLEALLVVGIRGESTPDLAGLLTGHSFTGGLELLRDGVATNNSRDTRAAHGRDSRSDAGRTLLRTDAAPQQGSAGARFAELIGIDSTKLGAWLGADQPRTSLHDAMRQIVGAGLSGALWDTLGAAGQAWSVVSPMGPSPTLRVGRQPYGMLPATALGRWAPLAGEAGGVLADAMQAWGLALGSPLLQDPADPPNPPGFSTAGPRDAAQQDTLSELLLELPQSAVWMSGDTAYAGVDQLVGPATGPTAPSVYLEQIASTAAADLPALADALPSLLAKIAIAAKQNAVNVQDQENIDHALLELGTKVVANERAALPTLLTATLDAASHRFDAWLTGAVTERLLALRSRAPQKTRVGAFGWLIHLEPSEFTRSRGHVLAPSLAHAATAAVLRAGYLAEAETAGRPDGSRQAMAIDLSSRRVRVATSILAAARAGQPLAAVLGRQFEEDLVAAGLQQYLAVFRKLTRFRTGSRLEQLEDKRAVAVTVLVEKQHQLIARKNDVVPAKATAANAAAALEAAEQQQASAKAAAATYVDAEQRITGLQMGDIPKKKKELDAIVAGRPGSQQRKKTIKVPDLSGG
jgi:hypothetical protein